MARRRGVTVQEAISLGVLFGLVAGVAFHLITDRIDVAFVVGVLEAIIGAVGFPFVLPRQERRWKQ